ncbi:multiheme c-type cytochrome, partial [Pseudoalteromonas sp. S3431]
MINIKNSLFVVLFLCSCFSTIANDECQSCHQPQTRDWKQSDHASSMALANKDTVLGDFNNVTTTHFSQKAVFYKEKDAFLIDLTEQGTKKTYTVSYVF